LTTLSAPAGLTGGTLWQINLAITSIYEATVNLVSVILFVAMLCYGTIKMKLCNNQNDTLAGEKISSLLEKK